MHKALKIFFILIIFSGLACKSTLKGWGAAAVDGIKSNGRVDSITTGAMRGLINELTGSPSTQKLDSLIRNLDLQLEAAEGHLLSGLDSGAIALRDSLLGDYLSTHAAGLRDSLTGEGLQKNLMAILSALLGKDTKAKLDRLIHGAINSALSDSTRYKLNHLLDTLATTAGTRIGVVVDTAIAHLLAGSKKLGDSANTELSFLQRHAAGLLATAAGIIAAIAGLLIYFFRNRNKIAKLNELLTWHIHHDIKSDQQFDVIKKQISADAKKKSVEPALRELLAKKGILGKMSRSSVPGRTP